MEFNRNMVLAIVLSMVIFFGFQYFFSPEPRPVQPATPGVSTSVDQPQPPASETTTASSDTSQAESIRPRDEVLAQTQRVQIKSPRLSGSITLVGGRLDDITLNDYRETVDPASPPVVLLAPRGTEHPYFVNFSWTADDPNTALPGNDTLWQADGTELAPGKPVTLSWDNGAGLLFERTFAIDEDFLLTVTQRVTNKGSAAVSLAPYGIVTRVGLPPGLQSSYLLHEGPVGVVNDTLEEFDYDEVMESANGTIAQNTQGGWIGFTDKYWSVLLIPAQDRTSAFTFRHTQEGNQPVFRADSVDAVSQVAPGTSVESQFNLFAGAKVARIVDRYNDEKGFQRFYLAVDYGWLFFLARPIYLALEWFFGLVGNFGIAIMLLVVCVRLLLFPLANKSYKSMAKMRKLQPKMLELRERFKDDKPRFQKEIMGLYKKEGANPLAGCLPILCQIPIFLALYNVLYGTIEMRHAPFFGWIQDLSAPDPTTWVNLFGLLPFDRPDLGILNLLQLGIFPILMGITMWAQYRLNPQPTDPVQAKIFAWMPIIFTFMLGQFQSGLVIYWCWNNLLSMTQQIVIMRNMGVPLGRQAQKAHYEAIARGEEPAKPEPKTKSKKK